MRGYLAQLGVQRISFKNWDAVDANPFFSPDPAVVPQLEKFMDQLRESGDSCGARYLPVLQDSRLIGVISFRDVAKAVLEEQDFENKMLKGYIKNWPA